MALLEKAISKLFSPADRDDFVVLLFEGVFRLSRELRDEKVLGFSHKFLQLLPLFGKRSRTVADEVQAEAIGQCSLMEAPMKRKTAVVIQDGAVEIRKNPGWRKTSRSSGRT